MHEESVSFYIYDTVYVFFIDCYIGQTMGWIPLKEHQWMEGKRTVLHNTNLESPYALTIDYDTQTLFWADSSLDRLESSSVDGSGRTLLTTVNIDSPFDITFYDGQLYWTDTSHDAILTTPLSSPNNVTFLTASLGGDPYGIQLISNDRQPEGKLPQYIVVLRKISFLAYFSISTASNPCSTSNGSCSHICVLSAVNIQGYTCLCPNGYTEKENGMNCVCKCTKCGV